MDNFNFSPNLIILKCLSLGHRRTFRPKKIYSPVFFFQRCPDIAIGNRTVHAHKQNRDRTMQTYESPSIPTRHALERLTLIKAHVAKRPKDGCSWAQRRTQTRWHTAITTAHWIIERMKLATAIQWSCGDPQRGSGARRRLDAGWLRVAALGPNIGGSGMVLGLGASGGATLVSSCDGAMSIWTCNLDERLQVKRACKTYPNATINSIGPTAQTCIHDKSINVNTLHTI
jgi:hypothetical protein